MTEKIKKNVFYLSSILIAILLIVLMRFIKLYDILCVILDIVIPILFGYIFAWIINPLFKRLNKKLNSKLSFVLLILLFVLVYTLIIWKFIPIILKNMTNLLEMMGSYMDKLSKYPFLKELKNFSSIDTNMILDSCSSVVSSILNFALIHIFGFYILFTYDQVNSYIDSLIPKKYKKGVHDYIEKMSTNMRAYLKGTLLDTAILFVISSILYTLIGLKYPIMLALFSAITNIIPFIGPYIGGIPAVLVGLGSSLNLGLVTVLVIVIAQVIESNIINPMIMSKCVKINPILIIISLTVMGKFLGLVGMIFAVPTLIIIKLSLEFYKKYKDSNRPNMLPLRK